MWLKKLSQRFLPIRGLGLRQCGTVTESASSNTSEVSKEKYSLPETVHADKKSIFEKCPILGTSKVRQAWVENLSASKWVPDSSQVIQLHPDVWAVKPR